MRDRGLIVALTVALAAVPGAARAASGTATLPAPRFGPPQLISPSPLSGYFDATADDRGNQLLQITGGAAPTKVLSRAVSGSWMTEPAGAEVPDAPLLSAAGDRAAALTWETRLPDRTVRLHVLAREPGTAPFVEAGGTTLPGLRSFSAVVDEAGRVFAIWWGGRQGELGLAIRPAGGVLGPPRVLGTSVPRYSPVIARGTGQRVVVVWSERSVVRALTAGHGRVGPIVDVARVRGSVFPRVLIGPHGEALITWPDLHAKHAGENLAVIRRARGGFGAPRHTRIPFDSAVIGGDGQVVAARLRPLGRRSGGVRRRAIEVSTTPLGAASPRWLVLDTDVDSTRFGPTAPVTLSVRAATLVVWTVAVDGDPHHRRIRAAIVRNGRASEVATVATYRGAWGNPRPVRRGPGATLLWRAGGNGTRWQLYGADVDLDVR
jgi:hypothetical protein